MELFIGKSKRETSRAASKRASQAIREAIRDRGEGIFVVATGKSQFDFLDFVVNDARIDWQDTVMFHLDEYVGIPKDHPASFRRYLNKRLVSKVEPGTVYFINGSEDNPEEECLRLNNIISNMSVDVAFLGVGENGHIAFNDPPADFESEDPFLVVGLDRKCREQQVGEGWFDTVEEVPKRAISMSVRQIMKSETIICTVPGKRKARAVQNCFGGEVSPEYTASILLKHDNAYVYLDEESASCLQPCPET